ncbi:MAG TPA: hypothetical protein VGE57_09025 [Solimonas sp.]
MLLAVTMLGVGLAATGTLWAQAARREREEQLLDIGNAYRVAIKRYYLNSPGTVMQYPPSLDDLLLDRRHLTVVRYLRKRYPDPITGLSNWGVLQAADGGIMGVYSLSGQAPLKIRGFRADNEFFADATAYSEWKFIFLPDDEQFVPR